MSSRRRELRLDQMLADSIVKAVMKADGVDPHKLKAELRQAAALLHTTRHTLNSSDACEGQARMAEHP